jgi:hypothetical protein
MPLASGRSHGGRLALVASAPPVAALVETSLLAHLIDVAPDCEQAVRLVGPAEPCSAQTC